MILFIWLIQLVIMASFDIRKDILNKLMNWTVLITSLAVTFFWGNIFWVAIPLIVIPVFAGVAGGTVEGFYLKNRDKKDRG